ncbi:MAG TPA: nucleoside monophosphate kinase [Solirubrobacteraceae bacterium]|nr:nucleoside monophosphate kinase [Solirubrobacteraceae bacterium]
MSRSPLHVILLGPPGAGKGTQAAALAQRLGLVHISPGQILREEAENHSPAGRQVRDVMAQGRLVPDELVDELVRERLEALTPAQGFVLDGYPRTAGEARALRETLAEVHRLQRRPFVVWLQAPGEVLRARIRKRSREQHRVDDTDDAVTKRLEAYSDSTGELRRALECWTDLIVIDADQPPDRITEEIVAVLCGQAAAGTSAAICPHCT